MKINCDFERIDQIDTKYIDDCAIKNEYMFYGAEYWYAKVVASPITALFLDIVSKHSEFDATGILDSRIHMLMPTWYPCIPGWHFDDLYRPGGPPNQPIWTQENTGHHFLCVIGNTSMPEFVLDTVELTNDIPKGMNTYQHWSELIEKQKPKTINVKSGEVIHFKANTGLHRGTPADKHAWRIFLRYSMNPPHKRRPANEIRTQVQVYIPSENLGW